MGQPRPLFHLFFAFLNKQYNFLQQIGENPVYSVGIRTHDLWNISHLPTTKPGAPALWLFFDMVKSVFSYFSQHNDKNKPYKCVDGMIGIQTRARRMVGAEESTEHWCPPHIT